MMRYHYGCWRRSNFTFLLTALFVVISLIHTGCKKDDGDTDTDNSTVAKLATVMTMQSGAVAKYAEVLETTGDSIQATNDMAQWIVSQTGVDKAYYLEGGIFEVYYSNGLRSSIVLVAEDANGQHLTRGGGLGNKLSNFKSSGIQSLEKIKNEKVLILNPFVQEFNGGTYNKDALFQGGDVSFDVNTVNGVDVSLDDINAMGDYGFTILNTHGLRYGFILFKVFGTPQPPRTDDWTSEEISAMLAQHGAPEEKFANGELEITSLAATSHPGIAVNEIVAFTVTERYIRNMGADLTGSVILGNHCYSGYTMDGPDTNNLPQAWRSKGVATYYGYAFNGGFSQPVLNDFCKVREDSLIVNLCRNTDSTGVAHLDPGGNKYFYMVSLKAWSKYVVRGEAVIVASAAAPDPPAPFYFYHFHEPNYRYKTCGDTMIDNRDMKVYKTVCIGNQRWMAENLNWAGAGECYNGSGANCNTYGRLYEYREIRGGHGYTSNSNPSGIQGVCPQGWHLPSRAEWQELIDSLGGSAVAGGKLKSTTGWAASNYPATDDHDFSALPGGRMYDGVFVRKDSVAFFGTSWLDTSGGGQYSTYYIVELHYQGGNATFSGDSNGALLNDNLKVSCRCVED